MEKTDKKELKRPDAFVSRGRAVFEFFAVRRERFTPVLVAGATLLVGMYVWDWWEGQATERAWATLAQTLKLPEEKDERWTALKAAYDSKLRGRAQYFAAVDLADHYFEMAKKKPNKETQAPADQAVDWYSKALAFKTLLPAERQMMQLNRGESYELLERWDEALKDYEAAAEKAVEGKPLALLAMARAYEAKGNTEKSVETYSRIAADYSGTEYAKVAKNHERRLKSPNLKDG